ncbi:MAG: NADAR family protein [Cyanobacteria bacterium SID2]|nr:NADAR family protein [Cyanobacteria bacterium SID2]MBP0003351.1 NADAR family protein [Cyanobacteria bacterium SBC]
MTIYFYKVDREYGCFSNFSPHDIQVEGQTWKTVEHYYQAQKFLGTDDEPLMAVIHAVATPEAAAQLGRDRSRTCRRDWDVVKTTVMYEAVKLKFLTHADIRQILLDTGDELLIEDSPVDYFWGCGAERTGDNHLGKILMRVREEIRQQCGCGELPSERTTDF